jgi:tetratricopeptide (TPR) repeat protein
MLFRSFASLLLLVAGAFALLIIFMLGISLGAFGPNAREGLTTFWGPMQQFYGTHNGPIDIAIKWLGGLLSAVTAAFAIYKSWYYAEFSLPRRLADLIGRRDALLHSARPKLLASVNGTVAERMTPMIYFYPVHRLLKELGLGRPRYVVRDLVDEIEARKEDRKVVLARMAEIDNEIVTGLLLKGSALAGQASMEPLSSEEREAKNKEARQEFRSALEVRPDDIDALMFAALQSEVVGDEGSAIHYLEKMEAAAASKTISLRRAEALRLKAEVLSKEKWDEARRSAVAGVGILDDLVETSPEKLLELAKTLLVLGHIQTNRERFTAAQNALNRVRAILPQLPPRAQHDVSKKLDKYQGDLDAAKKDKEEPGE